MERTYTFLYRLAQPREESGPEANSVAVGEVVGDVGDTEESIERVYGLSTLY